MTQICIALWGARYRLGRDYCQEPPKHLGGFSANLSKYLLYRVPREDIRRPLSFIQISNWPFCIETWAMLMALSGSYPGRSIERQELMLRRHVMTLCPNP